MIRWLRRWGWVAAFAIAAIVIVVLTVGKVRPDIAAEVAAAKADADAVKLEAAFGRDQAKRQIEEKYADTIKKLDDKQKKEAAKLADDPGARAGFYARVAAKRARRSS